jgi:hypothetical protein
MLDEMGRFEFSAEILDLVEMLWCRYREAEDSPADAAAQLAGLAYVVAVLRQDVEAIWEQVLVAPQLQGLDLAGRLAEQLGTPGDERREALREEMRRRGWEV